jgi:lipopolysaccharide export LptBFGC system permease protein LptF
MIIQRYILRELLITFALAFTAILAVCAVGMIFQTLRSYEGVTIEFIVRLAPVALTQMSPWAMTVASCLAVTLAYGRLAADNELDAIRTSGIHVSRILMPALLFGLILCGLSYIVHAEIAPRARYARRSLVKETLLFVLQNPPQGRQNELKIGSRNRLSYADLSGGRVQRPVLLILERARPRLMWCAREGIIDAPADGPPSITLVDAVATSYEVDPAAQPIDPVPINNVVRFSGRTRVEFELEDVYRAQRGPADMSAGELDEYRGFSLPERPRVAAEIEYHGRIARSLAPMVLVLLCAPVGAFVRKGSRLAGMGAALPPLLAYIGLMVVGEGLASRGHVSPAVAAYGSVAALAACALLLLRRVFRT